MDYLEKVSREINPRKKANIISKILFLYYLIFNEDLRMSLPEFLFFFSIFCSVSNSTIDNSTFLKWPNIRVVFLSKEYFSKRTVWSECYTIRLFRKGYKTELEERDLYEVLASFESKRLGNKVEDQWSKKGERSSIFKLLWKCFSKKYIFLGVCKIIFETPIIILKPIAFGRLVSYFSPGQTELTKQDAILYAVLVVGLNLSRAIFIHNYLLAIFGIGIQIRTAFCSFMYRKILKMTPEKLQEISIGRIVTLMTKDVHSFEVFLDFANELWSGLIHVSVLTYVMYQRLGTPALIGVSFLLVVMPFQVYAGFLTKTMRKNMCEKSDERLKATQETLSAIKIVKMYAWEKFFDSRINYFRNQEITILHRIYFLKYLVLVLGSLAKNMGLYAVIISYIWFGNPMTAEILYFVTTCFHDIKHMLIVFLPTAIYQTAELAASGKRVENVINAMESSEYVQEETKPLIVMRDVTVSIKGKDVLNINKVFKFGLNIIYGPVGSGKSILLKTILQEYKPVKGGFVQVKGRISYASQEPWVFPSTIKQNILFGEEYDKIRYEEVLTVCALLFDLKLLERGDMTIIEDRGINLSKGQKARINLARAVYRDADIYLLDDVLATLDAHVSDFIYNECIKKFLDGKLVVLVTSKQSLKNENVTVLSQGRMNEVGKEDNEEEERKNRLNAAPIEEPENLQQNEEKEYGEEDKLIQTEQFITRKVYHETKKAGDVDGAIYKQYLVSGGGILAFFGVICVYAVAQFVDSYTDKLVADWVNMEEDYANFTKYNISAAEELKDKRLQMTYLYTGMNIATSFTVMCRVVAVFLFARTASISIHKLMTNSIINATMHFFDTHFIGNILNRFSKDLMMVDENIPFRVYHILDEFISIFGFAYLIATVNKSFVIPALVFFAILMYFRRYYLKTSRSLKRLDAAVRSPVIGYLNSTLEGLSTIRAFKKEDIARDEFDRHQDLYTSASFSVPSCSRAFVLLVDVFSSLFITSVIATFLIIDDRTKAGSVGLALSQATRLAASIQWGIIIWADLENKMTHVERVLEYTNIEQENRTGIETEISSNSEIIFENVCLTYPGTTEKVLKNLNFVAKPHEKIGIVGRTGSGKSSIISVLFKLYNIEGRILVGGTDAKTLSLDFLRSKISIIPQDPVLFTGDIRSNIDPTGSHTDEEIWSAIDAANLKGLIDTLEFEIFEDNLSAGQRQLVCVARAIIRKNNIIILDEATANMDPETDKLVHDTINKCFRSCTVFVIAHRLTSVLDSDKIIVMDKGEILEIGSPQELLKKTGGLFFNMVQKSKL